MAEDRTMKQGSRGVARWLSLGTLALALGGAALLRAEPLPRDPVEELDRALRAGGKDQAEILAKRVQALRSIGDLCRALQLHGWSELLRGEGGAPRPSPRDQSRSQSLRKILVLRKKIGERFLDSVAAVIKGGNATKRLAVARLLGDMDARGLEDGVAAALVKLLQDRDPAVRAAAARAQGKIRIPAAVALQALRKVLQGDEEAVARRGAAEGLLDLVPEPSRGPRRPDEEDAGGNLTPVCTEVVLVAGVGLKDRDSRVRRLCVEAIQKVAGVALSLRGVREEKSSLDPLITALQKQVEPLARVAADKDAEVVLSGCSALEAIGKARKHLRQGAAEGEDKEPANKPGLDLLGEALEKKGVPVLARQLSHQEVRVRLAALYVLETLDTRAAPAAEAVVKALQDRDHFVRWGATRVLARLAPGKAEKAVPELVKLLEDRNKDVRLASALALERYGPAARDAVTALAAAVRGGDTGTRLAVIRVLVAVGTEARSALPALATALSDPEPAVRSNAARALSRFGPARGKIVEALRKALDDPDAQVRQAAADALLVDK
jgi:HEAT repeat protein